MFSRQFADGIAIAARRIGVEPCALMAVAEVESGGKAYALVDGRQEPLIRFEGHYFDRRLPDANREIARAAGLAAPTPGAVANPPGQAARWRMLTRAAAIDRKAAYESTSWGIGQVMGAHWAWLGYRSVEALVAEARSGIAGQARLMVRYIDKAGLAEALRTHDWARFACAYNGPGYRRNGYDARLRGAYLRCCGKTPAVSPRTALLRRGTRGKAVRALQQALDGLGYAVATDGIFGPLTESALRSFQHDRDLDADGVAGPLTRAAIGRAVAGVRKGTGRWERLLALVRRLIAAVA